MVTENIKKKYSNIQSDFKINTNPNKNINEEEYENSIEEEINEKKEKNKLKTYNKRIIELSLSNEKLLKKIQKLEISNQKLMERLEMKIDMLVKSEIEKKNLNQENTDADGADGDNK